MNLNQALQIVKDHIRIGKGMKLVNGVPEALEVVVEELNVTQKALELICDFTSEDTDICFWNESGNVANEYGGYDCDLCPRQPNNKCTKEWFLQQARKGDANG